MEDWGDVRLEEGALRFHFAAPNLPNSSSVAVFFSPLFRAKMLYLFFLKRDNHRN